MTELQPFLKTLLTASGLSGHEAPVRRLIEEAWQPLVDETSTSRLGSLHGLKRGAGPQPRPSLLLSAHMDAIGLMVTGVAEGWLRVTEIGGLDPRVLPGQLVTVHGRQDYPGVIVQPPSHLLPQGLSGQTAPLPNLLVDIGLLPDQVAQEVQVGDLVSFAQEPIELSDDLLVGHSLDNRASVAAVTHCLELLQDRTLQWDLWAVASTQEEETLGGALTSGFALRPTLAVAIDVTFGSGPGSPSHKTYPVGMGVTLGWGPNIHPALFQAFKELAERLEIPYKMEAMPRHSGTDAYALQVVAEGLPTMVVSIPLRYMHTPVEMVSMKDIRRAGRLLAEFTAQLDDGFINKLAW
jgi:tetrahedral aminopeptidase